MESQDFLDLKVENHYESRHNMTSDTILDQLNIPGVAEIRAIVFDLDGTLYVNDEFAAAIQDGGADYLAGVQGVGFEEARQKMAATRSRLAEESGSVQTLSAVCRALGGNVTDLHAHFQHYLRPESCLKRDERVVSLLERLRRRFALYIYTNNSRPLTSRILRLLGLEGCFEGIFTIDETWQAKPDQSRLEQILKAIGLPAAAVLFVGDRYEVDLRLPEKAGCPVYLSRSVDQLLRLDSIIPENTIPRGDAENAV